MNLHLSIAPLVSLIAGVLILAIPRLLNYIVGPAKFKIRFPFARGVGYTRGSAASGWLL
jgi:hypothetical protein